MNQEKNGQQRYGLFTAMTMIIGAVIGSGIFFKSDNILVATNGNVILGVLVFCFAAIAIVFGGLTIAELASRNTEPGGIITYMRAFVGDKAGAAFGWFISFALFPAVTAVLSWVSAIYFCILFNIEMTLEIQIGIGFLIMVGMYAINMLSAKLGGLFQNASTVIKLIPLFVIAIAGLFYDSGTSTSLSQAALTQTGGGALWIAAIPAIAFSFDGWTTTTMIAHEIKNSKRNFPIALVVCPLIILFVYVLYFVGISSLIGPDKIIEMGDAHLDYAATLLFGAAGAKIMGTFVLISILGSLNAMVLSFIRVPYSLAIQNVIPGAAKLKKLSPKSDFPFNSGIASFFMALVWYLIHYLTQKYTLLPNSDVSEITCVTSYLCYIALYFQVFKMSLKGEIGFFRGKICPLLATVGSFIIFMGGLQNPLFAMYVVICLIVLSAGYLYYVKVTAKQDQMKIEE